MEIRIKNENQSRIDYSKDIDIDISWPAVGWLFLTVIAIVFPILLNTMICIIAWNFEKSSFYSEIINGELYIYAVALLTPIVYIVNVVLKKTDMTYFNKKIPYKLAIGLLFISSILYTIVTLMKMEESSNYVIQPRIIIVSSVIIFFLSIIAAYQLRVFPSVSK